MIKNNKSDFSLIFSILFHSAIIFILFISNTSNNFKKEKNEEFEIIDAEIIGLIDQSKNNKIEERPIIIKQPIEEKIEYEKKLEEEKLEEEKLEDKQIQESIQEEPELIKEEAKPIEVEEPKKIEEEPKVIQKEEPKVIQKEEPKVIQKEEPKVIQKEEPKVIHKEEPVIIERTKEEIIAKPKIIEKPKEQTKPVKKKEESLSPNELKSLKESLNKANKLLDRENKPKNNIAPSKNVGAGEIATAKLGSYIKTHFEVCWKIPPLIGVESEKLSVIIAIKLNQNGNVLNVKIENSQQYPNNQFFAIISESAVQSVKSCPTIKNLPIERYDEWKDVRLSFDPSKFIK